MMETKGKNGKVKLLILASMVSLILGMPDCVNAMELEEIPYNEKYLEWINIPEEEREGTFAPQMYVENLEEQQTFSITMNTRLMGLVRKYSLLDDISLKIKNQMSTGQCWAFSTTTQLESYMAKVESKTIEYSPRHIEYSTAKTFLDGTNKTGFNREVNSGGNVLISYAYLISGQGPILEKDMPFVNTTEKINLDEIQGKTVQAQLEEFICFPAVYKEKNNGVITYSNGQTGTNKVEYTRNASYKF